jgi:vitamin B12 transporter
MQISRAKRSSNQIKKNKSLQVRLIVLVATGLLSQYVIAQDLQDIQDMSVAEAAIKSSIKQLNQSGSRLIELSPAQNSQATEIVDQSNSDIVSFSSIHQAKSTKPSIKLVPTPQQNDANLSVNRPLDVSSEAIVATSSTTKQHNTDTKQNLIQSDGRSTSNTENADNTNVTEILVTAQKMPIALKDTTQSATVYQLSSTASAYDALRDVPSLGATTTGAHGGQTSLFIRGGNSDHHLVLLNGVPVNQLSSGLATIERLPFAQFNQLEVVRGNVSAIYGSAAMSGVANLTQKLNRKAPMIEGNIGLGTHGTRQFGIKAAKYVSTNDGYVAGDISLGHENRFAQSAKDTNQKTNISPDRDGINQNNIGANIYYQKNKYQAKLHLLHTQNTVNYDKEMYNIFWMPDPIGLNTNHYSKGRLGYYHLIQQLELTPKLFLKADHALVQDQGREYVDTKNNWLLNKPATLTDALKQRTLFNALELRYKPSEKHTWVTQAETNFQKIDATSYGFAQYKVSQRHTQSGRIAYLYQDDKHRVDLNFRKDRIKDGDKTTHSDAYYLAGARYLTPDLQVGAIHAKAFKMPTFNQLYGAWSANPKLMPEKSKSYELFARYGLGGAILRTSIYQTKYKNLIDYDALYQPQNINRATAQGVEQSLTYQHANWQGGLFVNYQHVRNDTAPKAILRRPHIMARANIGYQANVSGLPVIIGGDIYHRAASKDYVGYSIGKLPSYTTVGLFAEAQLAKHATAKLSVNNLFNKKAQEVYGYPIQPRSMMLDVKFAY